MDNGDEGDPRLYLHVQEGPKLSPMRTNSSEPLEFETECFVGRCLFMHRPSWSFDNKDTGDTYPYKEHFHGRKRLWEWRLQGRFKRRPGLLYAGIELEGYVKVSWGTRALMKGLVPLIRKAINCNQVHHELGNDYDVDLRPTVVAPIWAFDNTLVHSHPLEAPSITTATLATGMGRKAAREYWETLWDGGGPCWDEQPGGPTFTFSMWGVSPLIDLQAWVFRKLPLNFGRNLPMEPFCGRQPVHAVMYELEDGTTEHRQENKRYSWDVRMVPEYIWQSESMGPCSPQHRSHASSIDDDVVSFCSAFSNCSDEELLQRELSQDFDDVISDNEETEPPLRSHNLRRWKRMKDEALAVAKRTLKFSNLRRCRRRPKPMFMCASFAVGALIFVGSGISYSLPSITVSVDWNTSSTRRTKGE